MLSPWLLKQQLTIKSPCPSYVDLIGDSGKANKEINAKAFNLGVHEEKNHTESLTFAKQTQSEGEQGVYFQDWKKYKPWGIKTEAKEKEFL